MLSTLCIKFLRRWNTIVLPAFTNWNNERVYGYPRILRTEANVGHGTQTHPNTRFLAINNGGIIEVLEIPEDLSQDQSHYRLYLIGRLTGDQADRIPVTGMSFADVTTVGTKGNIPAGDFSGVCCRDYVFAGNNQFSGGQEARDFHTVAQSDIEILMHALTSQLDQQIQADLLERITPTETLTSPLCSQNSIPTPTVGEEAKTVSVSVTRTCSAASYKRSDPTATVQRQLREAIRAQLGASYLPFGKPQVAPAVHSVNGTVVTLVVSLKGRGIYHFSKQDIERIQHTIAGKSRDQAHFLLLRRRGIHSVGIQVWDNQHSLPNDPARITVNVKESSPM